MRERSFCKAGMLPMAPGKGRKKVGPSFVGVRTAPRGSFARGGEGSSRSLWSQSLTFAAWQIEQTAYFANPPRFSFRMIGPRQLAGTTQLQTVPTEGRPLRRTLDER